MKFKLPKKEIGKFIHDKRNELGISQGKLAKKLNCNVQSLSNAERGICTPSNQLLRDIIINLNFTMQEKKIIEKMIHDSLDDVLTREVFC